MNLDEISIPDDVTKINDSVVENISIIPEATTNSFSVICDEDKTQLSSWGLPKSILKKYNSRGITAMFPWQVECLSCGRVLVGGNLIYSAPTSAGKTLVAEILAIKTVLERKKKVIIILPFVSVVREKMFYFQDLLSNSGVRVEGLMGSRSLPGGFKQVHIAVCTIEKANSLVNRLLEENRLGDVGAVVVDELHLLGDPFRGYLLELLLTKIRYMSMDIQLVGMSATLPNLPSLAGWLGADLYKTDFRPVPLREFYKCGPSVYDKDHNLLYDVKPQIMFKDDPEHVVYLCVEAILNGHSALVFCPTKVWCENLAQHLSRSLRFVANHPHLGVTLREQIREEKIEEVMSQLNNLPVGLDKVLFGVVSTGVAFHHAGLTIDERDVVEAGFRRGALRVLTATSTLSSGVNLPARRVIIRTPMFHGQPLDPQTYQQMIGRAGRMGCDTQGESFLICKPHEHGIARRLVGAPLKPVQSCLGEGTLAHSLKRAVLEVVASGVACTLQQLARYTACTLFATSNPGLEDPLASCIDFLIQQELIRLHTSEEDETRYIATPLGRACLAAAIAPDQGLDLFQELQRARLCFVLENELHIIYQVTPFSVAQQLGNLDWMQVLSVWQSLSASEKRIGELVGAEERLIVRAMRGTLNPRDAKQTSRVCVIRRFYTALALQDLVHEVPLAQVAQRFGCSRGILQALQQAASTFAGMVSAFCRKLGWNSLELLVDQFQSRLEFGIQRELCDLMRLDLLNGPRARALFDRGLTSVADVATASPCDVETALRASLPFQSTKTRQGESEYEATRRNQLCSVWMTGCHGLTEQEAALKLINQARDLIQKELGCVVTNWESENSLINCSQSSDDLNDSQSSSTKSNSCEENKELYSLNKIRTAIVSKDNVLNLHDVNKCMGGLCVKNKISSEATFKDENLKSPNLRLAMEMETLQGSIVSVKAGGKEGGSKLQLVVEARIVDTEHDVFRNTGIERVTAEDKLNEERCQSIRSTTGTLKTLVHLNEPPVLSVTSPVRDVFACVNGDNSVTRDSADSTPSHVRGSEVAHTIQVQTPDNQQNLSHGSVDLFSSPLEMTNFTQLLQDNCCDMNTATECAIAEAVVAENDTFLTGSYQSKDNLTSRLPNSSSGHMNTHVSSTTISKDNAANKLDSSSQTKNEVQMNKTLSTMVVSNGEIQSQNLFGDSLVVNTQLELALNFVTTGNKSEVFVQNNSPQAASLLHKQQRVCVGVGGDFVGSVHVANSIKKETSVVNSPQSPSDVISDTPPPPTSTKISQHRKKKREKRTDGSKRPARTRPSDENVQDIIAGTPESRTPAKAKGFDKCKFFGNLIDNSSTEVRKLTRKRKHLSPAGGKDNNQPEAKKTVSTFQLCRNRKDEVCDVKLSPTDRLSKKTEKNGEINTFSISNLSWDEDIFNDVPMSVKTVAKGIDSPHLHTTTRDDVLVKHNDLTLELKPCPISLTSGIDNNVITSSFLDLNFDTICDFDSKSNASIGQTANLSNAVQTDDSSKISVNEKPKCKVINFKSPMEPNVICENKSPSLDKSRRSSTLGSTSETKQKRRSPRLAGKNTAVVRNDQGVVEVDITSSEQVQALTSRLCAHELPIAVAFSFKRKSDTASRPAVIGAKIMGRSSRTAPRRRCGLEGESYVLEGMALCLGEREILYISLLESEGQLGARVLAQLLSGPRPLFTWDAKDALKKLSDCCPLPVTSSVRDPQLAAWLLQPENTEYMLRALAERYSDDTEHIRDVVAQLSTDTPARDRTRAEAMVVWHLSTKMNILLNERQLLYVYIDVEMPVVSILARLETVGFGLDVDEAEKLLTVLKQELTSLEKKAHLLAGHTFKLSSHSQLSKVLYRELRLPGGRTWRSSTVSSTSKEALSRLRDDHELPSVIQEWRKISATVNKCIMPFLKRCKDGRVFGQCISCTSTGRISMQEPNLQCVPRTFRTSSGVEVSVRRMFVARPGSVLVSADYRQLELRVLAHLARCPDLMEALGGADVFTVMAAQWGKVQCSEVTDLRRQHAKHLCYGILYGMGPTTLAQQLNMDVDSAVEVMEDFMVTYPRVKRFLEETVGECRRTGYITTLAGRRRYLPDITSDNKLDRGHAERQAVNSRVQGSAADIVKRAMVALDQDERMSAVRLVLNLHDELVYELPAERADCVASVLKGGMEGAMRLSVPLPVNVKMGSSWGTLAEVSL